MQRQASQQLTQNISNFFTLQKKEPSVSSQVVQSDASFKSSSQPSNPQNDPQKHTHQSGSTIDNPGPINNHNEVFQGFQLYRSRVHDGNKEKSQLSENRPKSFPGTSDQNDLKTPASSTTSRHDSASNPNSADSNHIIFRRHPRTNSNSSSGQRSPHVLLQDPHQNTRHQQSISQQQHQQLKQYQEILREPTSQNENSRIRAQTIRVRSYPTERQHTFTALHATLQRQSNLGQPWSIPRVSTAGSARPRSLTLPSTIYQDGTLHTHTEFSNYNPSASPRALRSHSRIDSDNTQRQASPTNSTNSSPSANNPPKSILKSSPIPEQSDFSLSFRPLTLPRAHSDSDRDFDFSSILTTNKDSLSAKQTNPRVAGQFYAQATSHDLDTPSQQPRPTTANVDGTKNELNQNERAVKKSVTFNSLVRLHHDNQVS